MKMEIYYFSGTGNSLAVARDIAARMNGNVIPIPSVMDRESVTSDADMIGIVFPVYNAVLDGMPLIVKRFANKLSHIDSKYVFAVCTCIGWSRLTIKHLGEIIRARGGRLSAGFTVPMPDNSNPTTGEKRKTLFAGWRKKLEIVCHYVNARKEGRFENTKIYNLIMVPFMSKMTKKTFDVLNRLAHSTGLTYEELLPLTDRSFHVDEKCDGCGICARVCPANDIEMIDNRPVWRNRCESCLACLNWCPNEAIQGSIASTEKTTARYLHPDAKVSDFIMRK